MDKLKCSCCGGDDNKTSDKKCLKKCQWKGKSLCFTRMLMLFKIVMTFSPVIDLGTDIWALLLYFSEGSDLLAFTLTSIVILYFSNRLYLICWFAVEKLGIRLNLEDDVTFFDVVSASLMPLFGRTWFSPDLTILLKSNNNKTDDGWGQYIRWISEHIYQRQTGEQPPNAIYVGPSNDDSMMDDEDIALAGDNFGLTYDKMKSVSNNSNGNINVSVNVIHRKQTESIARSRTRTASKVVAAPPLPPEVLTKKSTSRHNKVLQEIGSAQFRDLVLSSENDSNGSNGANNINNNISRNNSDVAQLSKQNSSNRSNRSNPGNRVTMRSRSGTTRSRVSSRLTAHSADSVMLTEHLSRVQTYRAEKKEKKKEICGCPNLPLLILLPFVMIGLLQFYLVISNSSWGLYLL